MSTDVAGRVQQRGQRAAHGPWLSWIARFGFAARGVLYILIGVLAVELALGQGGRNASQAGALQTVGHQPFGAVLLIAIAIGFAGYALWRFMQAALGHGPEGGGEDSAGYRIMALLSGLIYLSFMVLTIRVLTSPHHNAGSKPKPSHAAAGVLSLPGGQLVLGIVAIVLIGAGVYQAYRGVTAEFLKEAKTGEMSPVVRTWYERIGRIGYLGRAAVFGLTGALVADAAIANSARKAKGLDGALQKLSNQPYGVVLLLVIAAGLVAFGLYSLADARYRRI
jgi:uncharacterized protein DUF1206